MQFLKNIYHLLAATLAALFYGFPARKLKVIGVTGTDGKTTTVHLIYHLLKSAGYKVSMISTIKAVVGEKEYVTGFHVTTPSPLEIQKHLYQAYKSGSEYIVLEVSSHALDQYRVAFCNFLIGILTNVSHEHLDYHKTYQNYLKTKFKLLKLSRTAIVNRDDESYNYLEKLMKGTKKKIISYGIENKADFTPAKFPFKASISGEFNDYNILAAIAAVKYLGIEDKVINKALLTFPPPEGRMDIVNKDPFSVMIDFAHTPNALEKLLYTTRHLTPGKIILIFGCAGERDQSKRSLMGEIAAKSADYIIITAEDPRKEDLAKIIDQIAQGCLKGSAVELDASALYGLHSLPAFFRIPNRQEAIDFAIRKIAQAKDLVIVAGKGHEKTICIGNKEYPWSDYEAVKRALRDR